MAVSEAELDGMRARADHLRKEIRAFRTEGEGARLEADRESQAKALQDEIERLERETVEAARSTGGTVDDAQAAMERAAAVQAMVTPRDELEDDGSPQDTLAALAEKADDEKVEGNK